MNRAADEHLDCLIRGSVPNFDLFGQPGCWQDLSCIYGIQDLIMETYDDPEWVTEALKILQRRKLDYIATLDECKYDILELGGGVAIRHFKCCCDTSNLFYASINMVTKWQALPPITNR